MRQFPQIRGGGFQPPCQSILASCGAWRLQTAATFADMGFPIELNLALPPLSQIIGRTNELFAAEDLSEADLVNYALTIADKIQEDEAVMSQVTIRPRIRICDFAR